MRIESFKQGKWAEQKRVLGLIDERIEMLRDIMANSKAVNKNKSLMDVFKAGVRELEELKAKI